MRAIWACIMLLVVGASVILLMRYLDSHGGAAAPSITAIADAGTSDTVRDAATEPILPVRDPDPVEPERDPEPVEPDPDPAPVEDDPGSVPVEDDNDSVPVEDDPGDDPPAVDDEAAMVATDDGESETETPDEPAAETTEAVTLGDRFTVPGTGTEADPYQVTWDLLISASETYKPRDGMEDIPDWIMAMHDKHVQITGYVLIPMGGALSTTELLVMLNMWDGCCIGVPPSAYDAVEVGLTEPFSAKSGHQLFNYGSITGTLTVDPYLVNGWLMGLYLIEGGKFEPVDM